MTNILVTGASGGIGAAICKALAVRGVTVVLHYQSDRAAAEATRQVMEGGGHTITKPTLAIPRQSNASGRRLPRLSVLMPS